MCGISGYISDKKLIKSDNFQSTLDLMKRRGPDANGSFLNNSLSKKVLLLHTRLNIIDLNERSNQPFEDNGLVLIFNGEIYNYVELRNKLKDKYNFKTNSDTEVLLKSYQEFGENCVNHFIGMWSFAIWDKKQKSLFLSRDPFGEKPLFYFHDSHGFFFGSEIKFIRSLCKTNFKKNYNLLQDNLFLGYKSLNKSNATFYDNIFSLEQGSNLIVDFNLKIKKKKYWSPNFNINYKLKSEEASEGIKHYLVNSLKLRMRSDVPIAFCLSGGMDSCLLASHAKKTLKKDISTFSIIDHDERYNEKENINEVVKDLDTNSHLIYIDTKKEEFIDRLKNLTIYHDSPIATLSYYVHSFLSENISKKNYKVSISGTGADELFTGYFDHFLLHLKTIEKTDYFESNLNDWKKHIMPKLRNDYLKDPLLYIKDPNNRDLVYEKNFNLLKFSKKKIKTEFFEVNFCDELLRNRMMNELFHEVVPVILKHDDLNSMYYSIENRSPYLDRDLLEFSLTIPPEMLISDGFQKKALRDSAKNVLNEKVRNDKQKKGFNASISSVLDLKNSENIDIIFDKKSEISELIDLEKVKSEIDKKIIPNHISKLIFSILSTKIFLEQN